LDLTLKQASTIVDAAFEYSASVKSLPMAVAVLDAGGHLMAFKRDERCGILRPQIATGKAWACLGMGYGGREMSRRAAKWPTFHIQLAAASDGRVIAPVGGVLIRTAEGKIIGAVGVTGDLEEVDNACAVEGIKAAGLVPDDGGTKETI
jgi:uncharacterized protein GlcG (DUF336 family)